MTAQSNSAPTSDTQKATTPASSTTNTIQMSGNDLASLQFDGKRMRKAVVRKTVDYNTSVVKYLEVIILINLFILIRHLLQFVTD